MKQVLAILFVLTVVLGFSMQAYATLELRGEGTSAYGTYRLIYDTDLNITWYDFVLYRDFISNCWPFQCLKDEIAELEVTFGGNVYADWRLPKGGGWTLEECLYGTSRLDGAQTEYGHLYFTELGFTEPGWELGNQAPFINLTHGEYITNIIAPNNCSAVFSFSNGHELCWCSRSWDDYGDLGMAVRDGDICKPTADGNMLWNIRHNADDRFHSNESWLRPWRYSYEDGWGRWVGGYSYDLQWYDGPYTQSSGDLGGFSWTTDSCGTLQVNGSQDHQWHAWTYVYVDAPKSLYIPGNGACVPTIFVNEDFDNPINLPGSINLTSGWNRVDITGYNQNDGYTFKLNYALANYVEIMNSFVILPVRIAGTNPIYFSSLQEAYDVAGDNDTIQLQEILLSENLSIDDSKTIIIEGGYNPGYTSITGKTTVNGSMTISSGKVTIEGVQLW